jgi:hypothetical protein
VLKKTMEIKALKVLGHSQMAVKNKQTVGGQAKNRVCIGFHVVFAVVSFNLKSTQR